MNKKIIGLAAAVVLILGVGSVSFAKLNTGRGFENRAFAQNAVNINEPYQYNGMMGRMRNIDYNDTENRSFSSMWGHMNNLTNENYEKMIDTMKEINPQIAEDMKNGNYNSMNDFMNNISDEDYQKMIDAMKEINPQMAEYMENIDRDQMIEMHNYMRGTGFMGGAGGCHGYYGNGNNNGNNEASKTSNNL